MRFKATFFAAVRRMGQMDMGALRTPTLIYITTRLQLLKLN